jgi:hypothetical protein
MKRCPNGTRRNKKTNNCEKYDGKKKLQPPPEPEPQPILPPLPEPQIIPLSPPQTKKTRCPNGTRRNKKTNKCEKYNGKKKTPTRQPTPRPETPPRTPTPRPETPRQLTPHRTLTPRLETPPRTPSPKQQQYEISFDIVFHISWNEQPEQWKPSFIPNIIKSIISNARTNSSNEIISDYGIVHILKTDIQSNNDIMHFHIQFYLDKQIETNNENAENIIYVILPASYSYEDRFVFNVYISKTKKEKTFVLNILDTPTNIVFNQINEYPIS